MMAAGAAWMAVKQYRSKKAMREPQTLEPADVPEPMGVAETRATVEPSSLGYPLETDLQGRDIAPPASGHETGMPLVQAQPQERTTGEKVKQAASGAAQKTKEAASQASGKVRDVAGAARERVGQAYERTKEVASQAAHTVRDKAAQAKDAAADAYEEHPLAFAAAAVAAGVLLGQLVPSTRREDEMMGESRDKLVQGAKAKGREIGERAKATGEAALDAARDEADKQGAGPSGLREKIHQAGESIKEIGRRAKDAARQESEQQGLTPQQLSDEARDVARRGGQQAPKESDEDKPLGDRGPM
jgi:gas vesicle protein